MAFGGQYQWRMKQQSALELLITYSWAILIIVIMIFVAVLLSAFGSVSSYLPPTCYIQPLFPCQGTILSQYTGTQPIKYAVIFINKLPNTLLFPYNGFNVTVSGVGSTGTNRYTGNCTPQVALSGTQVTCSESIPGRVEPSVGTQVNTHFTIGYKVCNGGTASTCEAQVYNASGYATQTIGGSASLYVLTVETQLWSSSSKYVPASGFLLVNGQPYYNAANVFLPSGDYVIAAQPQTLTSFASFSVVSGTSTIGATSPTNGMTTLHMLSNTTILLKFTEAICNICNYSSANTPLCPAGCTTITACPATSTTSTTTTVATTASTSATTIPNGGLLYSCNTCQAEAQGYTCPSTCPYQSSCKGGIYCSSTQQLSVAGGVNSQQQYGAPGGGTINISAYWRSSYLAQSYSDEYAVTIPLSTTTATTTTSTTTSTSSTSTIYAGPAASMCT